MRRGQVQPGPVAGGFGDRWADGPKLAEDVPVVSLGSRTKSLLQHRQSLFPLPVQECTTCFLLTPVHKLIRRHKPVGQGPVADPQGSEAPLDGFMLLI